MHIFFLFAVFHGKLQKRLKGTWQGQHSKLWVEMHIFFSRPSVQRNICVQDLPMNYLGKKKKEKNIGKKCFRGEKLPCLPILSNNAK